MPSPPLEQEAHFVSGCIGCPFHQRKFPEEALCTASGKTFDPDVELSSHVVPTWCPLRERKILVLIDELRVIRALPEPDESEFAKRMRARRADQ